jgi:serine/threonine protein kinase
MSLPPDEPPSELERVVDAISEGKPVRWEEELAGHSDPDTLEALRLIDDVARMHRSGGSAARDPGSEPGPGAERTWGNMQIREPLGAGAYGEVYRAFDPGLRREVALKLWGATVRPNIIEGLLEEGRALARVRHPNVLLVHGADVHDGCVGMWTELLEGATLEQLIAQLGPGNWREAALYGIPLCRALAAVHAVGLVHRDVKASNVMRERGGRIVLMDFGSASRYQESDGGPAAGVQGTPLAMAPEVLNGEPASPVADIYSLGVLLFRVVASRHPVEAGSLAELRAALARGPLPSLRTLNPDVSPAFANLIERALERDPAKRITSATEMERMLAAALSSDWEHVRSPDAAPPAPPDGQRRLRVVAWASAAVATLALLLAGESRLRRPPATTPVPPMQFTLQLPVGEHLPQFANVVVSPDGTRIAFASTDSLGISALWIRRFDAIASQRLPGTEGASYPFWSPDGRDIAFFSDKHLKRVGADGDSVRSLCLAELGRGGAWSRHGTILFAGSTRGPLLRVPAEGGTPLPATVLDTANAEASHRWPCFLPDGDHFLFVTTPSAKDGLYSLYAGSLHSDRRVYIGAVESGVVYTSGMLVYMLNEGLEARPFNLRTLRWAGEPAPIAAMPGLGGSIAEPHASVSQNGTLVHTFVATRESRLAWIDARTGASSTLAIGPYFDPNISPDGKRIVAERSEGAGQSNLWLVDAKTGAAERWTHDNELNRSPQWSPRGDSILFCSNRDGHSDLYTRAVDGSLTERRVYSPPHALMSFPSDWRPGGLLGLVLYEVTTGYNVYELRSGNLVPIACTAAAETHCALSPDARWLAYDSDASGRSQIYVVDRKTSERFVLPTDGATQPRWARGTGRLYYRTPAGEFFELTPEHGKRPTEWPIRRLFRTGIVVAYDVDVHSDRLLCCVKAPSGRPEEIAVLVNLPQAVARGF